MKYLKIIIFLSTQLCNGQEVKTYVKGLNALNYGEYDSAIYYFNQVLDYDKSIYKHRGRAYMQKLEPRKAIKDLSFALESHIDSAEVLYYRSLSFTQLQNFDSASSDIRIGLRISKAPPMIASFHYAAGLLELSKGRYKQAINEFNKTSPRYFDHSDFLEKLSYCYTNISEPHEALKYASKATSINESSYLAHYLSGNAFLLLKKYDEAINSLSKALKINGEAWESFTMRGQCFYILSDFENARSDFQNAINLNPKDSNSYVFLGYMAKLENQKLEACKLWSKAIELGADDIVAEFREYCGK